MNRIGFSLPFAYLTGSEANAFHRLFGPAAGLLADLRSAGVVSIEMRVVPPQMDPLQVRHAAERIWAAGLELTVHGQMPPEDALAAGYPALAGLAGPLRERGAEQRLLMTLHALTEPALPQEGNPARIDAARRRAAERTAAALARLIAAMAGGDCPFQLALELNQFKPGCIDPSCQAQSLAAIHRAVPNRESLGLCWDMGHGYANVLRGVTPADFSLDFRQATIHTHIHDLGATGRTHWPLTEGRLPLEGYVQGLRQVGYQGLWHLELSPDRFEAEAQVRERMFGSIARLRAVLAASAASAPGAFT